jgi:hypothetical protein
MTVEDLHNMLKEYPPDAIICRNNLWDTVMEREVREDHIEYYESAVYLDTKGETQRGKIVVI